MALDLERLSVVSKGAKSLSAMPASVLPFPLIKRLVKCFDRQSEKVCNRHLGDIGDQKVVTAHT
jgi:hypothetical protein